MEAEISATVAIFEIDGLVRFNQSPQDSLIISDFLLYPQSRGQNSVRGANSTLLPTHFRIFRMDLYSFCMISRKYRRKSTAGYRNWMWEDIWLVVLGCLLLRLRRWFYSRTIRIRIVQSHSTDVWWWFYSSGLEPYMILSPVTISRYCDGFIAGKAKKTYSAISASTVSVLAYRSGKNYIIRAQRHFRLYCRMSCSRIVIRMVSLLWRTSETIENSSWIILH